MLEEKFPYMEAEKFIYNAAAEKKDKGARHSALYYRYYEFKRMCKKSASYGITLDDNYNIIVSGFLPKEYEIPNTALKGRVIRAIDAVYNKLIDGKNPLGHNIGEDHILPSRYMRSVIESLCSLGYITRTLAGYMYQGFSPIYSYSFSEEQKSKWSNRSVSFQFNRYELSSAIKNITGTALKTIPQIDHNKKLERKPGKKQKAFMQDSSLGLLELDKEKAALLPDKTDALIKIEHYGISKVIKRVGNREYSQFTSLKKKERECLTINGKQICEGADMPLGSFTVLLNAIIKDSSLLTIKPDKNVRAQAYSLASVIMKKEDPKANLVDLLGANGYADKSPIAQIKGWVRNWITCRENGTEYIDKKGMYRRAMFRGNRLSNYVKDNMPNLYYYICNLQYIEWRIYKNKTMYELLEYIEYSHMRKILMKFACIRVHDAIYCSLDDAEAIKNVMYADIGIRRKFLDISISDMLALDEETFSSLMNGK